MDISQILYQAYNQYLLPLGDKKVPTPYRINIPYQTDPRRWGKSSAQKLTQDVIEIAGEQNFNLKTASIAEIRSFMKKNLLGVDCSGYVYHCLDYLLKQLGKGGIKDSGLPSAGKTNVKRLASDEFSLSIESISQIKAGDFITFKNGPHGHAHVLLIMEMANEKIIYTQSSGLGQIEGVQQNSITILNLEGNLKDQLWDEVLANGQKRVDYFQPGSDGVRRLKALI